MWYNSFVTKNRKIIVYNKYIDKEAWVVYNALTDRQTTCLRLERGFCCDATGEIVKSEGPA